MGDVDLAALGAPGLLGPVLIWVPRESLEASSATCPACTIGSSRSTRLPSGSHTPSVCRTATEARKAPRRAAGVAATGAGAGATAGAAASASATASARPRRRWARRRRRGRSARWRGMGRSGGTRRRAAPRRRAARRSVRWGRRGRCRTGRGWCPGRGCRRCWWSSQSPSLSRPGGRTAANPRRASSGRRCGERFQALAFVVLGEPSVALEAAGDGVGGLGEDFVGAAGDGVGDADRRGGDEVDALRVALADDDADAGAHGAPLRHLMPALLVDPAERAGCVVGGVAVLGARVRAAGDQRVAQECEQEFMPASGGGGVLQRDGVVDPVACPGVELVGFVGGDRPVLAGILSMM